MKKAIMATYYHMCSTNENLRHEDCLPGADNIYEDLSKKDLLQRCLGGYMQNANESFNSTVWRLAPKHLHCGLKIIEIAAYLAAGMFNKECSFIHSAHHEYAGYHNRQAK
ncbi:hypothetical protein ALC56_14435 [Trachymyrmex septentrionalis]|uniref:Uncharacterized protein n=1 Tax=Trachymyrmex septentrionalis TaxID=34720 RepID=A0A195EUJ8_9HYME|nr:hypothetical protein ALC56_14435 [Trachymyrmex septentrionalis]